MSKRNPDENEPVTEKLCEARRETFQAEINGLKKTIWAASATAAAIIVFVQFILNIIG